MPTMCDPHWAKLPTSSSFLPLYILPIARVTVLPTSPICYSTSTALHCWHSSFIATFSSVLLHCCFFQASILRFSECAIKSSSATRSADAYTTSTPSTLVLLMATADTRCKRRRSSLVMPARGTAVVDLKLPILAYSQTLVTRATHTPLRHYDERARLFQHTIARPFLPSST